MTMKVKLDEFALMPVRAHETDAGLDIRTPYSFDIEPGEYAVIDTGVHIELPKGTVGLLKSKSGLNVTKSVVGEGVIDEGYTGAIVVKLYNLGNKYVAFDKGDKIIQLVIVPCVTPSLIVVDELEETERGNDGFGSTGK